MPLPVKSMELDCFAVRSQPAAWALTVVLPWKDWVLSELRTHGFASLMTSAMAVAPILTVVKPSTVARYAGCCWLTVA